MKTRKLVLIIADVLLLAVCIVQFALSARDTTKYFTFKDEPDSMEIVTPGLLNSPVIDQYSTGTNFSISSSLSQIILSATD